MRQEDQDQRIGLQGWMERIRDRDMPGFGSTVLQVKSVTSDEMATAAKLSGVILQDPALTAKLLKLANSVLLNPSLQSVSTVSRAIVVLGFDLVVQIVLSINLVDTVLTGELRERVVVEMARSFHAAVQARTAALSKGSKAAEEVFIAALLCRVGEMAFWCFGGAAAESLDEAMDEHPDERPEDLQMKLLGFRLRNLSNALAKEWHLGALAISASETLADPTDDERSIALGYQLAQAVEEGWDAPATKKVVADIAEFSGRLEHDLTAELIRNAAEASRVAALFGVPDAARRIGAPVAQSDVEFAAEVAPAAGPAPDPLLQLRILRDLAMMLSARPSLNDVLQLVLEGIYRGLGMSRAVFALSTPDRQKMLGRAALGRDAELLVQRFAFSLDGRAEDVVNTVNATAKPVWLKDRMSAGLRADRLASVTGQREGFLAPIIATGRVIGLFYADRSNGLPLDEETWQGFQHFVQQASLSFEHVANRGAARK